MRKIIANDIRAYLAELKKLGIFVSLCDLDDVFYAEGNIFSLFNGHTSGYCTAVKNLPGMHRKCLLRQAELKNTLTEQGAYSVCHAGVAEYIFPIREKGKNYGIVCVTGYKTPYGIGQEMKSLPPETARRLEKLYENCLVEPQTDIARAKALTEPLLYMFRAYLNADRAAENTGTQESVYAQSVRYIEEHFAERISLKDISDKLGYSVPYICKVFKAQSGRSVFAFLDWLRLKKAEELILYTSLTVTEIAYSIGFSDSNYFSNFFKKHKKLSPTAFRKSSRDVPEKKPATVSENF